MLGIGGHEGGPTKGRVAQQEVRDREVLSGERLFQHRTFPHRVGTPTGKEGHGGGKDQSLQDQAIALHPAAVAALGPRRLGVHVAQPGRDSVLVPVPLMPQRPLGLVHAPINGRGLGLLRARRHLPQNLLAQGLDLGFSLRQCRVQSPRKRAAVAELTRGSLPPDVAATATAFDTKLGGVGGSAAGGRRGGGGGGLPGAGGPPPPPNFAGVNGSLIRLHDTLDFGDMAPNEPMNKAYATGCNELKTVVTNWKTVNTDDLVAFNATLSKNNLTPIAAASPALAVPACAIVPAAAARPAARGRGI